MAHLPKNGKPTAFCILISHPQAASQHAGCRSANPPDLRPYVITWSQGPLAYVLATELTQNDAQSLGERIKSGKLPAI
jgi:hypothetical protein